MTSVVNSWILFNECKQNNVKLHQFLVHLAEQLMDAGKEKARIKRK